jgi:DNA-binding PadR family transcriptional regulator
MTTEHSEAAHQHDQGWPGEATRRMHHHIRQHLEHAARSRRHGWPPFDPAEFAERFSGPGGMGSRFGHGRRAARGDVRAAILVLLAEKPSHGYQIIQELERRSDGAWRASPGSVYPTLQQLEDEGLVRAVQAEGGRRVFELTDPGREEAKRLSTGPAPWDEAAGAVGGDHRDLRDQIRQLVGATAQVWRSGDPAHIAEARTILRDARRRIYLLLAGSEGSPSEKTEE